MVARDGRRIGSGEVEVAPGGYCHFRATDSEVARIGTENPTHVLFHLYGLHPIREWYPTKGAPVRFNFWIDL